MKGLHTILIFLLLLLAPYALHSQKNLLSNMQGLTYEKGIIFEIEGYTINIEKNKASLNEKDIQKIKKKYGLKNTVKEGKDDKWQWQNYAIESVTSEQGVSSVIKYQLCYLLPETDNTMTVILFESLNRKDTLIEYAFMDAFFKREVMQYVSDNWNADKIDFAGRTIPLGNICAWVSPYNVHCPSFGQISWSEFRTLQDAEVNNEAHLLVNKHSGMYNVIKEEEVDIIFEGTPTKAKRVIYKLKRSKILLGGRNEQVVYYVTQRVRGRYISCVLSQYIEEKNNYQLAPLLQEVMSLISEK